MTPSDEDRFRSVYQDAERAGLQAVSQLLALWASHDAHLAAVDPLTDGYIHGEGCGCAWISVNGNTAFARWAKRCKGWRKQTPSGVGLFVRRFGQSENRKLVYARAFAEVLRQAGIDARCDSRSD